MSRRWLAWMAAATAVVGLTQPPAQSGTVTKQGTPTTLSATADQPFVAAMERDCDSLTRGHSFVIFDGDHIGVMDSCKDGRGLMAQVGYKKDGERHYFRCQNLSGYLSKVQCQFNWADDAVPKSMILYIRACATCSNWEIAATTTWLPTG